MTQTRGARGTFPRRLTEREMSLYRIAIKYAIQSRVDEGTMTEHTKLAAAMDIKDEWSFPLHQEDLMELVHE